MKKLISIICIAFCSTIGYSQSKDTTWYQVDNFGKLENVFYKDYSGTIIQMNGTYAIQFLYHQAPNGTVVKTNTFGEIQSIFYSQPAYEKTEFFNR